MENKKRIYSNYKRDNKWLGIIDYKSLTIIIIYIAILVFILKLINLNIKYSFYLLVLFSLPIISLIVVNRKNESALDILIIILNFFINRKVFVTTKYISKDNSIYKNIVE